MEELPTCEIKSIGHLGIIAAIFKDYKIVERINTLLPKISNNQNVTHGEVVLSMIMQGLGFSNHRLYFLAEFFSHVAKQGLFREGVRAELLMPFIIMDRRDFLRNAIQGMLPFTVRNFYSMEISKAIGSPGFQNPLSCASNIWKRIMIKFFGQKLIRITNLLKLNLPMVESINVG